MMSPAERSQRARVAALKQRAQGKGTDMAPAREAEKKRYLAKVDELYPGLPEPERQKRAIAMRKAHYAEMTYRSLRARAAKKKSATGSPSVALKEAGEHGSPDLSTKG